MTTVLELIGVSKHFYHPWTFRRIPAIEELSFAVREGEVFGLIGHNGAGKTTTFKILTGLLRPTRGQVLWLGKPEHDHRVRRLVGFAPEQPYFYDYLTVRETLEFYAHLYGLSRTDRKQRIADLVERFALGPKLDARLRTLSKGNLQRVAVAQAILHRPKLAILDEPMSGLDPVGRRAMRDLIAQLGNEGTTVLFSSHVLSDAEMLCDRVAILARGRLREIVDLSEHGDGQLGYRVAVAGVPESLWQRWQQEKRWQLEGRPERCALVLPAAAALQGLLRELVETTARIESIAPLQWSLEERFLQYMPPGSVHD
ncbi:MAG: ABC transporter ATP-binding protein [Candidatus Binatia bacterium]|nr:MAG: ABC transporter ATP-binding protein [Candidatus Binatia bacterium]